MYKRRGCELWTIEEKDYWYLEEYRNDKEQESGFRVIDLRYDKSIDLINQIDVVLEHIADVESNGINRYLGYFKKLDLDTEEETFYNPNINRCNEAIFIVCQDNYLDGVEIIKEVEL